MRRDAVGDDDCLSVKRVIRACECALEEANYLTRERDPTVVGVREGTAAKKTLCPVSPPHILELALKLGSRFSS